VQGHICLFLLDLPPSNGDNGEGASERFIFEKEGQRCKVAKEGVKTTLLHTIGATMQLAHIYIYIFISIQRTKGKNNKQDSPGLREHGGRPTFSPKDQCQRHEPLTATPG
jgi:hypothetical protein